MLRPLYKGKRSGQSLNDYYWRLNICKSLEAPVPAKPKCLETKETMRTFGWRGSLLHWVWISCLCLLIGQEELSSWACSLLNLTISIWRAVSKQPPTQCFTDMAYLILSVSPRVRALPLPILGLRTQSLQELSDLLKFLPTEALQINFKTQYHVLSQYHVRPCHPSWHPAHFPVS